MLSEFCSGYAERYIQNETESNLARNCFTHIVRAGSSKPNITARQSCELR